MHACAYYILLLVTFETYLRCYLRKVLRSKVCSKRNTNERTNEGYTYLIIIRLGRSNQDRIYISLRMRVLVLPVRLERFRRGLRMAPCPSLNPYGYVTCPWGRN